MVKFPRVSDGTMRDRLYGIDDMGGVPRDALVMNPMLSEITRSPIAKTSMRLQMWSCFMMFRDYTRCCISTWRVGDGMTAVRDHPEDARYTASAISPISTGRRFSILSSR